MASCKAAVSLLATSSRDAAGVMHALNAKLCDDLQKREFVAMVYAHCDRSRITIVNAGMPDPLLIRNGSCRPVVCNGNRLPLGVRRNHDFEQTSLDLRHGDRLLLFSDGLPEAMINGEPLGYERVEEIAASGVNLLESVRAIPGVTIEDDATTVVISPTPR